MKYLLIDTNVYIDMIVARNQAHTPEVYHKLIKLIENNKVKVIIPDIVVTEVFRHLDEEIDNIGKKIKDINKEMDKIYWVNDVNKVKSFNEKLEPVKRNIKDLEEEFKSNAEKFKEDARQIFKSIVKHKETISISETTEIMNKVTRRQLYKQKPFEYRNTNKDCMADAVIIETLIQIKNFIKDLSNGDKIYFVSQNYKDFCVSKTDKNFHSDIMEDIRSNGLEEIVCYRDYFTKMILDDFKEEIEDIGIDVEVREEYDVEEILKKAKKYYEYRHWGQVEGVEKIEAIGEMIISIDKNDFVEVLNKVSNIFTIYQEKEEDHCIVVKFWEYIVRGAMSRNELKEELIEYIKKSTRRMMWFVQYFPITWETIRKDKTYMHQITKEETQIIRYLHYYQLEEYRELGWNLVKRILEEDVSIISDIVKEKLVSKIVEADYCIPPQEMLNIMNRFNYLDRMKEYLFSPGKLNRRTEGILFANNNAEKIKLYLTNRSLEKEVVKEVDYLYKFVYFNNFHDVIKQLLEDEKFKQRYEEILKNSL
ncbi:Uncharacterised protein [[Clostridium] sordellii]|uniref:PIN domain-containing protein n=1 Tax=Paraclostridium sordellii TaxID=1505 RepID=UPI0005DA9CB8|nr:PIN domain-containing protein [Paeniclostridium sordellii]CEN92961.1 Uncharacterised protein [[Clostridium] sordellii] [Paeniclostridium sordellii]CEN96014.1 Uncharacterised protein [[Clostridium] sordellii] [Paeniclostridium sordellii]CEP90278.1 Uncharacterised protein [[Clostridium] sordellii] [Paeniclostridium sordellii]